MLNYNAVAGSRGFSLAQTQWITQLPNGAVDGDFQLDSRYGTVAAVEADDTLSSGADLFIAATVAVTQDDDTLNSSADLAVAASLSATEQDDALAANGLSAVPISATVALTEADDAVSSAAALALKATLSATDADDSVASNSVLALRANGRRHRRQRYDLERGGSGAEGQCVNHQRG
jgi:hypothetical protein